MPGLPVPPLPPSAPSSHEKAGAAESLEIAKPHPDPGGHPVGARHLRRHRRSGGESAARDVTGEERFDAPDGRTVRPHATLRPRFQTHSKLSIRGSSPDSDCLQKLAVDARHPNRRFIFDDNCIPVWLAVPISVFKAPCRCRIVGEGWGFLKDCASRHRVESAEQSVRLDKLEDILDRLKVEAWDLFA